MTHHYLRVFLTALKILIVATIANGQIHYNAHTELTNGLNVPNQIVFDTAGYLYVANHSFASYSGPFYNTIAKVDPSGNKTVFVSGYSLPSSLVIDQQQNIYFTQNNAGSVIRKADPTGTVTSYASLPHQPGPITLYQSGASLDIYTVSHWGSKSIYRTTAANTFSLFDAGSYGGNQVSADGQFLFAWLTDTLYRFNTNTQVRQVWVSKIKSLGEWGHAIGPDSCLYLIGRSVCDSTKKAVFRINGYEDITEIVTQLPMGNEFHGIAFHKNSSNETELYLSEVVNSNRGNPLDNRIIKFNLTNPAVLHSATLNILGSDTTLCSPVNLSINAPSLYASILWSTNDTTGAITINQPGTFWVQLKSDFGCQLTDTILFSPCPYAIDYFLHDTLICTGETLTLLSPSFGINGLSLQHLWSTNDTTPTITVTPGQTTIYTVIVTNGVDTLYDTCFVYVAAANAGPDATICSGDTTQLLAVSGAGGYTWLPSTALSSATVANPQAWPTVTTQYKLGALYQVQGFSRTCYDSATVTVHPLPQPNLGPNITQCQGNPVTLNPGAGFSSYLWSNNAITSTITVNQSGTWWVKVKNSFDCEKTDTIVVNLIPYPQVTLVPAEDTVCSGDTLVIKAISSIPNSTFSWSTGSPADSIIVAPGTLSTYIVTVTNQGCARIDTAIIHTKPQPNPYITATKYMMCDGDTTILMANTLYPMSGFQWSSGQTTQSITVAPSASTTYHVTLSLNGCIQDTSVAIEVNPVPQVNLTAAPIQVCLGDSTEITAVSSVWGTQFSWSTGQTGNKIVNYPQTPVNISVIGTVNGCTGYDTVHIQTKPVPDVLVTVSQNPICMGDTVVMTASSTLAGCSFIWSTGAVTAQISETPWFGTVYMVIATLNGCYIDTTFVVDVNPRPVLTISPTPVDLCIGDQAVITVTSDLPGTSFSWNNGMTGSPITFTPASSSVLGVTGAVNGCEQTDWVAVNVHPYPTVDLGPDSYICDKETITLQPAGNYALLTWWDGTTGMQKSIYEPGTYWVTAGLQQCSASDTVTYLECPSLVVPNAFTPNGDGLNDEFYPVHKTLDIKSIHIYNRWGAQIFYTINPTDRWDGTINGKPCPEGVYFYVIRYYNPMINIHQEKGGAVHLLR
jgi:gliding motility-associated-like protein